MELVNNQLARALSSWRAPIVALTLFATACQDVPTSIPPVPGRGVNAAQSNAEHLGQMPFFCTVGNRMLSAPSGWQARQDTFYFSRGDLDARGRTVQYSYRRKATDGTPLVSVDCTVPYTEAALRRVDRWLDVEANGGVAQFKAREDMVTIQGCVSDETTCMLDPLVVTPPPTDPCSNCEPPPPPARPSGGWTGGGGSDGGGGGAGGSDGPSESNEPPGGTDGDVVEQPEMPNCASPRNTHEEGWCAGTVPLGVLLDRLRASVTRLRNRGGACVALGDKFERLLASGGIRVTSSTAGSWGAAAQKSGDWAVFKNHMVDGVSDKALDWVISHEMDHSVGNTGSGTTDDQGHLLKSDGTVDLWQTLNSVTCRG